MPQADTSLSAPPLRIVVVGHVDHGKSTLIGRLLHDTGSLPAGKKEELEKASRVRGADEIEWSFLLDAFQAERDQNVTIDTTQAVFRANGRDYVMIDAPGHREFIRNMMTGASSADAAILVTDVREGAQEQTRRHAALLGLLGLRQVIVAVTKMDLVSYKKEEFERAEKEARVCLTAAGIEARMAIPVCAKSGAMLVTRGDNVLPWYKGSTLVDALGSLESPALPVEKPLRFVVQDVYRHGHERIVAGRVESGTIAAGDVIHFLPSGEKATVAAIRVWPDEPTKTKAGAGEVIGITLVERIFVERGQVAAHEGNMPSLSKLFTARLFRLSKEPLRMGDSYRACLGTIEAPVSVQTVDDKSVTDESGIVTVTLRCREALPLDPASFCEGSGRIVLYDETGAVAAGLVLDEGLAAQKLERIPRSRNITRVDHLLDHEQRAQRQGHYGGVFWLTGLSAAGKSTLAMHAERELFDRGRRVYVLDGDNIRHGLCADLGFSPKDRAENIRRIGEVAALMADAGLIVITAFISPYRADRMRARAAIPERFHEIYVRADLNTCEARDPKGLYKKARAGEIRNFTGISAPYEPPENPELIIDTEANSIPVCVKQIVSYIERNTEIRTARHSMTGRGS